MNDRPLPERFERRRGGWWTFGPRLAIVLLLWAPLPLTAAGAVIVLRIADDVPAVPDLSTLLPSFGSRVESATGLHLAGADAVQAVPIALLPPLLLAATIAAEDEDFFTHRGFSLRGIARAALDNQRLGQRAQGASTITQQLAKRFVVPGRTYERKIHELVLARRLEASFSKTELLDTYLASVFFGHGAHGVTQASWRYFSTAPQALDLNQIATLAGILPSPSRYNPITSPALAARERNRVLRRMHELAMIDEPTYTTLTAAPLALDIARAPDVLPEALNTVLRALPDHLPDHAGDDAWASGAAIITVSHRPAHQALARQSLQDAIVAHDRRQGWRGAPARVLDAAAADLRLEHQPESWLMLARIQSVHRTQAEIVTRGGPATLQLDDARWAEPAATARHFKRPVTLSDLTRILQPDDLVFVTRTDGDRFALAQLPALEGALIALDSITGEVLASVGGFDAESAGFNRAEQACRQPGSVFKTVLFTEALHQNLTPATMLSDAPRAFGTGRGTVWRPRNADRDFKGYLTLANAFAASRNIPAVHLIEHIGARPVIERARRMGINSPLEATSSVALGASCVLPIEMARVHAALQRRGLAIDPQPLLHIGTADGKIHLNSNSFASGSLSTAARLDRMASPEQAPRNATTEATAHIMLELLRRVVTAGTAHTLPRDWQVAGKTGTTNEFDAWFVGLDGHITVAVWLGSEHNTRPLGAGENGATLAIGAFEQFYAPFARLTPAYPPPAPAGVVYESIDPASGLLARPGEPGSPYPFLTDTAPTDYSPTRGTRQSEQIDSLLYDF
ncbi:MAG: transglycosylase domain-containing protein [Bradymonadaceae bacterium]|nr:transglycosylase domain-containing protein [Lujinxingiaceae bacterium]